MEYVSKYTYRLFGGLGMLTLFIIAMGVAWVVFGALVVWNVYLWCEDREGLR